MKTTSTAINRSARRAESQRASNRLVNQTPVTDWSFQPASPDVHGGSASFHHPHRAEDFRSLSSEFFAAESKKNYRLEAGVFVLMAGLAVWPIVLAAQAAIALLR